MEFNEEIMGVAQGLVALCRQGKFSEAIETYYGEAIESVEGNGETVTGLDAVRGKAQWWNESFEVHSAEVEGPFVASGGFAVKFTLDVTDKAQNKRFSMSEVAVYTVAGGKIVREEFYYQAG